MDKCKQSYYNICYEVDKMYGAVWISAVQWQDW
jgi:hypothetical protein